MTELQDEIATAVRYVSTHVAGSQLALANSALECSQGTVSKIVSKRIALTPDKGRMLDEWLASQPSTERPLLSFEVLANSYIKAKERDQRKPVDVFLAFPMSASSQYEKDRKRAERLVLELRKHDLRVYWAGDDIASTSDFDSNELAYQKNLTHIKSSRLFVLYLPRRPKPNPSKGTAPSSIWIELGMALARNMPSTIFAPSYTDVPFIVRRALEDDDAKGKIVDTVFFGSRSNEPIDQVRRNGRLALVGGYLL